MTITHDQKNDGNTPIISSDIAEIRISCQYKKEDLLKGLTAYDEEDGYLTDKILIGGFSNFSERGVSSLDYAVYDKDGNQVKEFNTTPSVFYGDGIYTCDFENGYAEFYDEEWNLLFTSDEINYSEAKPFTVK